MKNLKKILEEAIKLDVEKGDVILTGRFKNKRKIVKTIGTDRFGQPTINGKSILKFKIEKHMPKNKMSAKTRKEMNEMRGLRRTIRRIIAESLETSELEKLAVLIGQGEVEYVNQAIELGEMFGVIYVIEQFISPAGAFAYFHLEFSEEFYPIVEPHLKRVQQRVDMDIIPDERRSQFILSNK